VGGVVVWWCGGCGGVVVGGGVSPCARTFQGKHSVRLWTPTILKILPFKSRLTHHKKTCLKSDRYKNKVNIVICF
jgi:hypothetical protein